MQVKDALKAIKHRLEAANVSHKALEALLKLEPVLDALQPTKATRLDITYSLVNPVAVEDEDGEAIYTEGADLNLPRCQWELVSASRVKPDEDGTVADLLEPFSVRLAAIAASPVIHYGQLKSILTELATAIRGQQAQPDLEISLWQCYSLEALEDGEEDWAELLEP